MLISDVIRKTGLTRKSIYFYEEKGLVKPEKDKDTGVRQYSEEDVYMLTTVLRLRELDMPVATISNIFNNPEKSEFVLQKHSELLQDKLNDIVASIGKLNTITNNFPPNGNLDDFQTAADIVMPRMVQSEIDYKFDQDEPIGYVRRITMQLFEGFLDLPLNSTERWDAWYNLLNHVEENCTEELIIACEDLFASWDLECLYQDFRLRKELVYSYTKYSHEEYISKSQEIIQRLSRLVQDGNERQKWLDYYWNFLSPVLSIDEKKIGKYIEPLSSVYKPYSENFNHLVLKYLKPFMTSDPGIALRNELKEVLGSSYKEDITIIQFFDFYNNTVNSNPLI